MKYYVMDRLRKWENLKVEDPVLYSCSDIDFNLSDEMLSIGYLEVFDSMEAFDKAYPLYKPLIFESVEGE